MTGSDFSDLILNETVLKDSNSNSYYHKTKRNDTTTPLKVAKFPKIDWNALEKDSGLLGKHNPK